MKYGLLSSLFCFIFISGCSVKCDLVPKLVKLSSIQVQSQTAVDDLQIISSNVNIRHGDFGFITIQGHPQTRYKITTSFRRGNRTISVTQWRITGDNGQATFNWVVGSETMPGTYKAIISGGGRTLNTYHTVLP